MLTLYTERSELLSIAPLQVAPIKSSVDVSPFSEAPLAYRWLQIEPKELRMVLGDFEPFYCHFALYDISKRVRLTDRLRLTLTIGVSVCACA